MKLTNGIELVPTGPRFTAPAQVLFNASKVFEGFNIKKEVNSDLLSCLAPLTVESCNFLAERPVTLTSFSHTKLTILSES